MTTIQPTVGRKVHYRTGNNDHEMHKLNTDDPLDATIVGVWEDGLINVVVFDCNGKMYTRNGIRLRQEGQTISNQPYCEWMPFQVGQAKAQAVTPQAVIKPQAAPTENKVTPEQITALMARVTFKSNVEGTSTFVHAYLDDKFYLATGHSALVDPANFNATTGHNIARKNASLKAHDKLWELEGYALWKQLQAPVLPIQGMAEAPILRVSTERLADALDSAKKNGYTTVLIDNVPFYVKDIEIELKLRNHITN